VRQVGYFQEFVYTRRSYLSIWAACPVQLILLELITFTT